MTTQSALNIGNQNKMINQSYHDAGIPLSCTDGIERMLCKLSLMALKVDSPN